MFKFFQNFFNPLEGYASVVASINNLESSLTSLSLNDIKAKSLTLKKRHLENNESLDDLLPEAFALVRATAQITLKQRHFDVQLIGGLVLHQGKIAEMMTGEGKTLSSTAPIYLNALAGRGVHVVTVNEYLAKRDMVWMGQIYHSLGLSVACLIHEGALIYDPEYKIDQSAQAEQDAIRDTTGSFAVAEDYLRPISRSEAYQADITYGTNHEFGFDYLRDNLAKNETNQVQRPFNFAFIDEIDSVLIDEARTPLIISAPDKESSQYYKHFAQLVATLNEDNDYTVDEKLKSVSITDEGIFKVEKALNLSNLYDSSHIRLVHYLEESLKAKALFSLDRDYVVKNNEIIIVDQFTGRLMPGRRYSGGLHQAIEAKERVTVQEESRTYAKISLQNYFKMYPKLAGMTGTAKPSAEEFSKVYNLDVITIPTHRPLARIDKSDVIYKDFDGKLKAIAERIKEAQDSGQPVLVGTTSITKNELVDKFLTKFGISHETLNAKNHEREGAIIAQAGRPGAVTVATNLAGRGVDIVLGGNPPDPDIARQVREAGGLLVVGTERHEARRIDDQLRGRAGRQGDPGASQFYLSLDDDLLRVFGGDRLKGLMERFNLPDDQPIEMKMVSRSIRQAQERVEGFNFDARKHLLEYDDILNKQRHSVYRYRQTILSAKDNEALQKIISAIFTEHITSLSATIAIQAVTEEEQTKFISLLSDIGLVDKETNIANDFKDLMAEPRENRDSKISSWLTKLVTDKIPLLLSDPQLKARLLAIYDMLWMNHLEDMEALQESVRLRAYGQKDPLIEYRREGHLLFQNLFINFRGWIFDNIFRLTSGNSNSNSENQSAPIPITNHANRDPKYDKVGRNDPCPCGSGKKFKKCHGA